MPKLSPQDREKRQAHIIGAAIACFSRKGFHQTTMRDIFNEAQVSPGAVHRYFPTKLDLLKAICDLSRDLNVQKFASASEQNVSDPVAWLFRNDFSRVFKRPDVEPKAALNIDLVLEAFRNQDVQPIVRDIFAHTLEHLSKMIRTRHATSEKEKTSDPNLTADVLCAQYIGALALRLVKPDLDTDAMFRLVLDAVLDASFDDAADDPDADKGY